MKYFVIIVNAIIIFASCSSSEKVTDQNDYNQFLSQTSQEQVAKDQAEYLFWSGKLKSAPHQYPYMLKMAAAQNKLFAVTGHIEHLQEATKLIEQANLLTNSTDAKILRALAKNYITQHRFTESYTALVVAEQIGTSLVETEKILFDINMELGNYEQAEHYLGKMSVTKNDFDYLIRKAKWEDHQGNLSETILYMNRALEGARDDGNKDLMQWAVTNLGDYYGHDGQIKKSYDCYLKALEIDPGDAYAKKGIAWIVYSYERNAEEAERILKTIDQYYNAPSNLLLLAEIEAFNQDLEKEQLYLNKYLSAIESNTDYGNMYNKYNILIYSEMAEKQSRALALSQFEVDMRPTAQSYSLLAWSHYKMGNTELAKEILLDHVKDQTYEPEPLFLLSEILKADKEFAGLADLKAELVESAYELGPVAERQIRAL